MGFILEKIEEAIKELLIGWIESNMTNMFTDVNDKAKRPLHGIAAYTR